MPDLRVDDGVPAEVLEWRGARLEYAICGQCGLKYMRRRPTQSWYAGFYQEDYWQEQGSGNGVLSPPPRQIWRARETWKILRNAVSLTPESLVMDVGSGWGEALGLLAGHTGCRGVVVEPSEIGRTYISQKHGFPVVARLIEELTEPGDLAGRVDLIILSHVLESTIDPVETLRIARRLLSPTGAVYIDTCNFYYYNAVTFEHPYIFSPETLEAALGMAKFEVVLQDGAPHPSTVRLATASGARYLRVLARPSDVQHQLPRGNVSDLLSDQARGLALIARGQLPRRILRKLRRELGRVSPD